MQRFVGAGVVGQHWLAFVDNDDNAPLNLARQYSGPAFAYVVNDASARARFRAAGVSMMSDCVERNMSCAEDILDPIVRKFK